MKAVIYEIMNFVAAGTVIATVFTICAVLSN